MDKDYSKYSYAEFCNAIDEDDNLELILDYEDFCVWRDTLTGRYFYIETGENDASEFCELRLVAKLTYNVNNDLLVEPYKSGEIMGKLFNNDCCGEHITDDFIECMWFKEVVNIGTKVFRLHETSCSNINGKGLSCHLRERNGEECPYRNDKKNCEFHQTFYIEPCLVTGENIVQINNELGVHSFATRQELVEEIKKKKLIITGWIEE